MNLDKQHKAARQQADQALEAGKARVTELAKILDVDQTDPKKMELLHSFVILEQRHDNAVAGRES